MKLAMIGVGQAGGKVVDRFIEYDADHGADVVRGAIVVNTAKADLRGLTHIDESKRSLVGQAQVKGHGVGADNELGTEVMESDVTNPPLKGWACRWTPVLADLTGRQASSRHSRSASPTSGRGDVSPLHTETFAPHGVAEIRYSSPRCSPR